MAKTSDYGLSRGSKPKGGYGLEKGSRPQQNNNRGGNGGHNGGGYGGNRCNNGYGSGIRNNGGYQSSNIQIGDAKAPYNFVPLNDRVVRPPIAYEISDINKIAEDYAAYITSGERFSGYFEVEVTNLTPLYIGGANGFFSNGQNVCIPGSSMRGCIKNLFKIITCSAFRGDKNNADLTDKHLYYRSFASPFKVFNNEYANEMSNTTDGVPRPNATPGFIVRYNREYYIVPAQYEVHRGYSVSYGDVTGELNTAHGLKVAIFMNPNLQNGYGVKWHSEYVDVFSGKMDGKRAFYRIKSPIWSKMTRINDNVISDYLNDVPKGKLFLIHENQESLDKAIKDGYAISGMNFSGVRQDVSVYSKVLYQPYEKTYKYDFKTSLQNNRITLSVELDRKKRKDQRTYDFKIIDKYGVLLEKKNSLVDKYKRDAYDLNVTSMKLLKGAERFDYIAPCFYVEKDGEIQHFGLTPYYRIPNNLSIGDHIPKAINDTTIIDFADAVFGRKEDWASRVLFEDMYLEKNCDMFKESYHKILASPNPTSFQLYLNKDAKTGEACTWENGNASIRGYKLYWHTKMDWQDNPKNTKAGTKIIAPLKPNHTFKGHIRFENLDAEELGALCYVFALAQEKNTCFKIGMGKSIGMGTIKTSAKLMLRTEEYYSTLFDENGFAACVKEVALNNYKDKFDRYIEKKLTAFGGKSLSLYKERMKELRMILSTANMDNPKWNQTVATMDFIGKGEDKKIANQRKPLPSISEVFGKMK